MSENYIEIAIRLARMYGVAETLNPIPCKPDNDFSNLIHRWTTEYIESNQTDLVKFFEDRITE